MLILKFCEQSAGPYGPLVRFTLSTVDLYLSTKILPPSLLLVQGINSIAEKNEQNLFENVFIQSTF